jgi:hypothetical protein
MNEVFKAHKRLPLANFRLALSDSLKSAIENWQSAMLKATRYREVVLTSSGAD